MMSAPQLAHTPSQSPATIRAAPIARNNTSVSSQVGTRSSSSVMAALCQARTRVVMRWLTYTADRRPAPSLSSPIALSREEASESTSPATPASAGNAIVKSPPMRVRSLAAVMRGPAQPTHRWPSLVGGGRVSAKISKVPSGRKNRSRGDAFHHLSVFRIPKIAVSLSARCPCPIGHSVERGLNTAPALSAAPSS